MAAAFDSGAFQNNAFEVDADGTTSIDLTAASIGLAGQAVQGRLAASIGLATLATSAQAVQAKLAANMAAASQSMAGQGITAAAVARLTMAAIGFTTQAIDLVRSTAINLANAVMNLTAHSITVTGAIAAAIGSWLINNRRRRR